MAPDGNYYALNLDGAKEIADLIYNSRKSHPFFNSSDFWRFVNNPTPNDSNPLITPLYFSPSFPSITPDSPSDTPKTLNVLDRGREEIFRRAYNYLDTKSGAFRFYGIGRALAKNGSVSSQVAIEALIELKASQDSSGNPILTPVVVWKKTL